MRPHPIPNNQVCSECGLDWALHPESPRRRDCIELLKNELVHRPSLTIAPYSPPYGTGTYTHTGNDTAVPLAYN